MNTTHGGGNQPRGEVRGDPGVPRTSGADTRDPDLNSFLGGEGRALIEQWQRRALALTSDRDVMRDDRVKARVLTECANELDALLTVSGAAHQEAEQKNLARMDTMGSAIDSRTAPANEAVRPISEAMGLSENIIVMSRTGSYPQGRKDDGF